ncbi:hypothetical protein CASFOL_017684 [Castilleja foliolosa]|uniref:Trehalase n=1 Tax=Castilleja foliolosa TaxID=1961234 RepID=A0ABD3D882_9LAMI
MDRANTLILIITSLFITIMSNYCTVSGAGDANGSRDPLVSFLERVQETALNTFGPKGFDPKLYVDMPLKQNLLDTEKAFDPLSRKHGSVSPGKLKGFLKEYMDDAGEDLEYVVPADFEDEPKAFLPNVTSPTVRDWALEVHKLLKNLSRKVSDRVRKEPDQHTLLPLNHSVIIPGSRFREVYYWDSYWVIRGLLVSKMHETAKGIVYNLISLIDTYKFVLNGARKYYTNRSQPPLLSSMVIDIFNRTGDMDLVKKALPALMTEHTFWTSGVHEVTVRDSNGAKHSLSRYYAMWNKPRPESSTIDKKTASKLSNDSAKEQLYREIASTAESGWDFSTRFMRNESDLATLATTSILPVDLNAFILKMEVDIISLANAIRNTTTAEHYLKLSEARKKAIDSIFWNRETRQWHDYWLSPSDCSEGVYTWNASSQNQKIFASNFMPLWIKPFHSDINMVNEVVQSLQNSSLIREAGIATSLYKSGQQWDFPNGWAPIQHMIVEGLVRSGSEKAKNVANKIALSWIKTNYVTFKKTGAMHEKYDVEKCGGHGGGGEYASQTGFGWSNGVVLAFLEEFGWPEKQGIDCL